jgi:hypothetical protein
MKLSHETNWFNSSLDPRTKQARLKSLVHRKKTRRTTINRATNQGLAVNLASAVGGQ